MLKRSLNREDGDLPKLAKQHGVTAHFHRKVELKRKSVKPPLLGSSVMKSTYIYEHWCKAIPREARGRLLLGVPGFGRLAFRHDVFVMREFNAKLKSVMKSTYIYEHWCQAIPREARRRLLLGVPSCRRLAFRHDVSCHVIGNIPRQISRRPHSCSGSAIASS